MKGIPPNRREILRTVRSAGTGLLLASFAAGAPEQEEEVAPGEDLGEAFEEKEHRLFGKEGFEKVVAEVAGLEKQLGIYELSRFTPDLRG